MADMSDSSKPLVVMTCALTSDAQQKLEATCDVRVILEDSQLLASVRGARGLVVYPKQRVDAQLLDAAGSQLQVLATVSVGLDHVDLEECRRRGIPVGYTPGVLTTAVAELTVALILSTIRRLQEGIRAVHCGDWSSTFDVLWLCGGQISGSVVGIVGLGRIGLAVANRLKAFQPARVIYCSTNNTPKPGADQVGAELVGWEELLAESDIVVATCSVSATRNQKLFDAAAFSRMRSSAIFINVTRGALVDQEALLSALTSGQIAAAGLDVASPEPLPPEHPLLQLPNCTVLPHLGSASRSARSAMSRVTLDNVLAGLQGKPLPSPAP